MKIEQVISNNFCIGCGACAAKSDAFKMEETQLGLYQAKIISKPTEDLSEICPFATSSNEDTIGRENFEQNSLHDSRIGYYKGIYAGSVSEGTYRKMGSSGGLTTWILSQLMATGEIDAVVHVGPTNASGNLFDYRISESIEEIQENSKTRYYPSHMADVLRKIKRTEKKYAFVGVPCFIKAIRLLAHQDIEFSNRVGYCIAIFCGHFKSKFFAEMIGWQQGVPPEKLSSISFREKEGTHRADQYSVQVWKETNTGPKPLPLRPVKFLYGMDWGLGYFKPMACDWCDDIAGETADLACGDAWLPEFTSEAEGTNIAVARNSKILKIIEEGMQSGALSMQSLSVDKVYQSQAANYRHRREGLSVRIKQARLAGEWHPPKRVKEEDFSVPQQREKIYSIRSKLASHSLHEFSKAKGGRYGFLSFVFAMLPLEITYYRANGRLLKETAKLHIALLKYLVQKAIFRETR